MDPMLGRRAGAVAAVLAFLAAGTLYAEAVPPWEAPDEPWHLAYAEALAAGNLPTADATYEAHQPPLYYIWPALVVRVLGVPEIPRAPDNPRFPFATAAYQHLPDDPGAPLLRIVRTFSGLLGALVVVLTWVAASAAAPSRPHRAVIAAVAVALLPQLLFISHSVSNDTLAAACGALVTYGLVRWAVRPDASIVAALAVGTGLALGLLTKLNVLALLPAVFVGAVIVAQRRPRSQRWVVPSLTAGLVFATVALALWLALPATAASLVTEAVTRGLVVRPELAAPLPLAQQVLRLVTSLWARFGWLNVDLPWPVTAIAGTVTLLGLIGVGIAWRRMLPRERRIVITTSAVCLASGAAALKNLVADPQPQGRLLFPALSALAILLATGWDSLAPAGWRWRPPLALAFALATVNLMTAGHWLPLAYAGRGSDSPAVDARVVAVPWREVASLAGPGGSVRQTFHAYRPGLHWVAVAVSQVGGDGTLALSLLSPDQGRLGGREIALAEVAQNSWLGLEVGPLAGSAGRDYVLELAIDGAGWVTFWGTDGDAYPEGTLAASDGPAADLMLLTLVARPDD